MRPLVSICCTTFNHQNFIKDALKGFIEQKTKFPIEILIHDDASTDRTPAILREYEKTDPRIKVIYQKENKYSQGEKPFIKYLFKNAKGKYIAMCEGDDFWTDPFKLQKQVDFLENNNGYVLSFHDALESGNKGVIYNNGKKDLSKEDLILNSHLHTSTVLFYWNKEIFSKTKAIKVVNGDTALYSILGHFGKGKYIKTITPSIYRIHDKGVWSGKTLTFKLKSAIETYNWILQHSDIKYKNLLREKILKKTVSLLAVQISLKNWRSVIKNVYSILILSIKTGNFKYLLYFFKKSI